MYRNKKVNLKNLERGDKLQVMTVWRQSTKQLTVGNTYEVIAVRQKHERHEDSMQFCIVTDTGQKRWYYFYNMMFKLTRKNGQYNAEQLELMHEFSRGIESLTQNWNINSKTNYEQAERLFKQDRDSMIDEYLIKLNKAYN